jgi:hypothetical protein
MIGGILGQRGISNRVVKASTGRSWDEWLDIIDSWDGGKQSFTTIARYLQKQYRLNSYWAQAVAVHYIWKRVYSQEHWDAEP